MIPKFGRLGSYYYPMGLDIKLMPIVPEDEYSPYIDAPHELASAYTNYIINDSATVMFEEVVSSPQVHTDVAAMQTANIDYRSKYDTLAKPRSATGDILVMISAASPISSNNQKPSDLCNIKRALVVGLGGVGANLAFALAKEGYALYLIDHDTIEEKNLKRMTFLLENADSFIGKFKTDMVRDTLKKLDCKADIESSPIKFENCIDSSSLQSFFVQGPFVGVCCADSKEVREKIEDRLRKNPNCKFFLHVGCNLNSITIMPSVKGIIASQINTNSSYDIEPDTATLMKCCAETVAFLKDSEIRFQNNFLREMSQVYPTRPQAASNPRIIDGSSSSTNQRIQNTSIQLSNYQPSWLTFLYRGDTYMGKKTVVSLDAVSIDHTMHYVNPDASAASRHEIIIGANDYGEVHLFTPDMRPFTTPHTFSDGKQCTGRIRPVRNHSDLERYINDVEASIHIANMDSAASQYFNDIKVDKNFINFRCSTKPIGSSRII